MYNIFCSGGGSEKETLLFDQLFFQSIDPTKEVLHIPLAMLDLEGIESSKDWIKGAYPNLNIKSVNSFEELAEVSLMEMAAVYVSGGNTFHLAYNCDKYGIGKILKEYVEYGGIYYGGSAGAIYAGSDITPAEYFDRPIEGQDLLTLECLSLIPDLRIIPHYQSYDEEEIIERYRNEATQTICLFDASGLAYSTFEKTYKIIGEYNMIT